MNVFCEQADTCTVVSVEGDLAVPDSDRFKDFLAQRIESGSLELVLDFDRVIYIDSSGISTLLALLQTARDRGGDIRLCCMNDRIQDLFRHVGLNHVFRRFKARGDAIKSFNVVGSTMEEL